MILDLQQRHVEPEVTVLEFSGRLQLGNDLGSAEHRVRKLLEAGHRNIVFDFSKLEYVDSAGVGMLLLLAGQTRDAGGQFRLVAPTERVTSVLKMARVYEMLSVHGDVDAAVAHITAAIRPTPPPN